MEEPTKISIRISGLKNKLRAENYGGGTFSHVLQLPADAEIWELENALHIEQPSKHACIQICLGSDS
jgi:hypothetical protein